MADADGDLHLVGRSTELVIVNGFNVYPAEVEAVFARNPGSREVAVTGEPDEITGEAVVAYVVPAPGRDLDAEELLAPRPRSLARFKLPSRICVVDALPHTVTGKIMKWQLAADGAPMPAADHHVTLVTRAGCHLCEDAETVLAPAVAASSASATTSSTSTPTRPGATSTPTGCRSS